MLLDEPSSVASARNFFRYLPVWVLSREGRGGPGRLPADHFRARLYPITAELSEMPQPGEVSPRGPAATSGAGGRFGRGAGLGAEGRGLGGAGLGAEGRGLGGVASEARA